jgi:hypothetical protein
VERVRPVRIGLVGYGKGGRFFHAPLIAAAAGCELTGVVTRSAERRCDLERDHPGTPAYDDLAQLASAGADAVAISAPADTHVPLVLEAVPLGLPVVCDKPFALQSAAARQALQEAQRAGLPLTDPTIQSVVTVTIEPDGAEASIMTIEHELLPPALVRRHAHGWTAISAQLESRLRSTESRSPDPGSGPRTPTAPH